MKIIPLLFLTALLALANSAGATVTETFQHSYPLAANGSIHLDNVNGDIQITAWDKAEVSLVAEKKAKTAEDLQRVTLEISPSDTRLVIKTKYARKNGWLSGNVDASVQYTLMVPAGASLDKIDSVNSEIRVSGVRGAVKLETVNGRILATGLAANAQLESVNGGLQVEFASLAGVDQIKLESVNGGAEVTLPKGAGARIDADSVNGGIRVDQPITLSQTGHHSLKGVIGSDGPAIEIETVNGGIAIREK